MSSTEEARYFKSNLDEYIRVKGREFIRVAHNSIGYNDKWMGAPLIFEIDKNYTEIESTEFFPEFNRVRHIFNNISS